MSVYTRLEIISVSNKQQIQKHEQAKQNISYPREKKKKNKEFLEQEGKKFKEKIQSS